MASEIWTKCTIYIYRQINYVYFQYIKNSYSQEKIVNNKTDE